MIRYALKCPQGHRFDSWFQNAAAFDTLAAAGHVACPDCGATTVEKSLMAPDVRPAREAPVAPRGEAESTPAALAPKTEREKAIAALKRRIEAESDYVGKGFAREARAIHDGDAPERPIYGEAKPDEALALIEDGVPVAPLPFTPTRKTS
ncbi:DUF1178 family protein [Sinisalibacter aestuarii]|uniref:DUF1178 family protein n=1 Tax=Sinisalibacter aestuarii TaxID=2949426 RepID=A0ABQ5LUD0_9RHOB|nr:DUF1178 family protein [Sinisalibacter aestuarii]GKY88592.1 hypothetical protein STA1M1_24610 [Sinisalibacter aestuarii]